MPTVSMLPRGNNTISNHVSAVPPNRFDLGVDPEITQIYLDYISHIAATARVAKPPHIEERDPFRLVPNIYQTSGCTPDPQMDVVRNSPSSIERLQVYSLEQVNAQTSEPIRLVEYNEICSTLVLCSSSGMRIHNRTTGEDHFVPLPELDQVAKVSILDHGKIFIVLESGLILIYDPENQKLVNYFGKENINVKGGNFQVLPGKSKCIAIFKGGCLATIGKELQKCVELPSEFGHLAVSVDGKAACFTMQKSNGGRH